MRDLIAKHSKVIEEMEMETEDPLFEIEEVVDREARDGSGIFVSLNSSQTHHAFKVGLERMEEDTVLEHHILLFLHTYLYQQRLKRCCD